VRRSTDVNRVTTATSVARWMVHRYPAAWRSRYEDEVRDLLDHTSVRWRDVADLTRGLITERTLALFEPGDHPGATSLAFFLFPLSLLACLWLGATVAGHGLQYLVGPLPSAVAGPIALAEAIALLWSHFRFWRKWRGNRENSRAFLWGDRRILPVFGWQWLGVAFAFVLFDQWTIRPAFGPAGYSFLLWPVMVGIQTPVHRMGAAIQEAMSELRRAQQEMQWARLELERCESLVAQGQAAPLDAARAEIARIEQAREHALASLHAMGYRARFRQV
jgi:hypothetical protein